MLKSYIDDDGCVTWFDGVKKRKTYINEYGYMTFEDTDKTVHRDVAYYFIWNCKKYELPFGSYQIHHKDGDRFNNNVNNLEIKRREEHIKEHNFMNTIEVTPTTEIINLPKKDKVINIETHKLLTCFLWSFFIPGAGQCYNHQPVKGILVFILTMALWAVGIGILIWIGGMIDAVNTAQNIINPD